MHVGTWLVAFVMAAAVLFLWALTKTFFIVCIKGFDPLIDAQPCRAIESTDVPGIAWDKLEKLDNAIASTGARYLGYLRIQVGPPVQISAVWWANGGDVVIYAATQLFNVARGEARALAPHVTCSSGLMDGTQIQTVNVETVPCGDTERYRVRSFPRWMPVGSLLDIHAERLRRSHSPVRPVEPSLDRIVAINNDSLRLRQEEINRAQGIRQGPDGRLRVAPRMWVLAVLMVLPPIGIVVRARRHARMRRELRELGLIRLWKKPS